MAPAVPATTKSTTNEHQLLTDFKSQYELQKTVQMIATRLGEVQVNGAPIMPNAVGTPLNNLLRDMNIAAPIEAPEFNFELDGNLTLDDVIARCTVLNINMFDVTRSLGSRSFYDATFQQANDDPRAPEQNNPWREYSRPEAAERSVEFQQVVHYENSTQLVNWTETMPKLKLLFKARIYTNDMAKACMMLLVHKYHPEQAILLIQRNANQIATHLLRIDSNRDKRTYHRSLLLRTYRTPEEDIPAALQKAQLIIDSIYPQNDPAYAAHRSSTFRTALISFLHDTIAAGVLEKIQRHHVECLPLSDEEIKEFAIKYEAYSRLKPTTPLLYGRTIGNTPATSFIQLNSTNSQLNTIYPAYPAYPSPYANPYPPYPYNEIDQVQQMAHFQRAQEQPHIPPPQGPNPNFQQAQPPPQGPNPNFQQAQHVQHPQQNPPPVINQNAAQLLNLPQHPPAGFFPLQNPLALINQHQQQLQIGAQPLPNPQRPQPPFQPQIQQSGPPAAAVPSPPIHTQPLTPESPTDDETWTENQFHTPARPQTGGVVHSGDRAVWNLPYVPTPKQNIDYEELPTNAKVFIQEGRRIARINSEFYLVRNYPEDVFSPVNLMPAFKAVKTNTAKSGTTSRKSSRDRKQTDVYQAGLNAAEIFQAQLNAIASSRGYVDPQGRYRSYSSESRQNTATKSPNIPTNTAGRSSQNGYSVANQTKSQNSNAPRSYSQTRQYDGRNDSRTRYPSTSNRANSGTRRESNSNNRPSSQNNYARNASKSPSRNQNQYTAATRPSRSNDHSSFRSANRSASMRKVYPLMQKGVNCASDYNPYATKHCTKCNKPGHHEFECARYYSYSINKCTFCATSHHRAQDCQETKSFPPNVYSKN